MRRQRPGVRLFGGAAVALAMAAASAGSAAAQPAPVRIGVVIMHGKGGSPGEHVGALAGRLQLDRAGGGER